MLVMKTKLFLPLSLLIVAMLSGFNHPISSIDASPTGAWHLQKGDTEEVLLFKDGYFSHSTFDKANKKFISTYGGAYRLDKDQLVLKIEFDTRGKDNIGQEKKFGLEIANGKLAVDLNGGTELWTKTDEGVDNLAGVWRITGRMVDGKLNEMNRGDRKTLKLLSATRFQWMAINPATKEFFGTGGGTYTFVNGKYTENIEFFSRDSTRVGASLSFDGKVKGDTWNHSGKSSKGDPINEVWTKEKY